MSMKKCKPEQFVTRARQTEVEKRKERPHDKIAATLSSRRTLFAAGGKSPEG
jgi:hypothetical protein